MGEDVAVMALLYTLLGLAAFVLPRFVRYAEEVLNLLDGVSVAIFVLYIVRAALNLRADDVFRAVSSFVEDFLTSLLYLCLYLVFANISRYIWFGRFSLRRMLQLVFLLPVLLVLIKVLPRVLPG